MHNVSEDCDKLNIESTLRLFLVNKIKKWKLNAHSFSIITYVISLSKFAYFSLKIIFISKVYSGFLVIYNILKIYLSANGIFYVFNIINLKDFGLVIFCILIYLYFVIFTASSAKLKFYFDILYILLKKIQIIKIQKNNYSSTRSTLSLGNCFKNGYNWERHENDTL